MRKRILGTAAVLCLVCAGTAQADTNTTTFDSFNTGTVNGQDGWKVGSAYDQEVLNVAGGKALRISNAVTAQSFGDMPYSKPVAPAGENASNDVLVNEFTFKSASPQAVQPGLAMSVSPTNDSGARMSYVRLEDRYDGVRVFFDDVPNQTGATEFTDRWIATLDRATAHTIRFESKFVKGNDNDIVRVYIDNDLKACGTSWENYYRFGEQNDPSPSDRLMWRLGGTATNAAKGDDNSGFLFDNVKSESKAGGGPAACPLPTGPQGPAGEKGETGNNGHDGTTFASVPAGSDRTSTTNTTSTTQRATETTLIGATMRTIHAPKLKGMKLVSVRANLRNKVLPVRGHSVKVDLRGRTVGNYNVQVVAKYQKNGKTRTVRSIRTLSIARK